MFKLEYKIGKNRITFKQYPFKCADVVKNKRLHADDIQEMVENFFPPALRIKSNELIFISAKDKEALIEFCKRNQITINKREDLWGNILDQFVDTEFSAEYIQKSAEQLARYGINPSACNELRQEVTARMFAYNFTSGLWEWVQLSLYDVLGASIGHLSGEKHRLSDADFAEFYFRAMEIALKSF